MDVRLSSEHEALRDSAARALARLGPRSVEAIDDGERQATLRAAVDEAGWRTLRDAHDGGGAPAAGPAATGVEVAIVAEELGRFLADVAYVGPVMAADLRRRAGVSTTVNAETVVLDTALESPASTHDGRAPAGVAIDAGEAASGLLFVLDPSGDARLGAVAIRPGAVQLDLTRRSASPDPVSTVTDIGGDVVGEDDLAAWTALGLAVTCADLVGVMRGAVDLACAYVAERRQYGVPIGSFQAVQHLLADAHVATEGSRSVALHAAWAVDALAPPDALCAAAVAKTYCARAARRVCETVVQVHGGIGHTWECLAHVFLRRALLSSELFGGADAGIDRILAHHGLGDRIGSRHGLR